MIQVQPNARYVILGEDRAHASLTELVHYHQGVGIQPFMETLTVPCGQVSARVSRGKRGWGVVCTLSECLETQQQHLFCVPFEGCPILTKQLGCFCMCWEMLLAGGPWDGGEALAGG